MTVQELIDYLRQLPPTMPVARLCGGDSIGYTAIDRPRIETLFPSPDTKSAYGGELFDDADFQSFMRSQEIKTVDQLKAFDWTKKYPAPKGTEYLVF